MSKKRKKKKKCPKGKLVCNCKTKSKGRRSSGKFGNFKVKKRSRQSVPLGFPRGRLRAARSRMLDPATMLYLQ